MFNKIGTILMSVLLTWHSVTNKKNTAHALTQTMIELKMCSNDFSSFEDFITQRFSWDQSPWHNYALYINYKRIIGAALFSTSYMINRGSMHTICLLQNTHFLSNLIHLDILHLHHYTNIIHHPSFFNDHNNTIIEFW